MESLSYITWRQAGQEKKHWVSDKSEGVFLEDKRTEHLAMKEDKTVGRARRGVQGSQGEGDEGRRGSTQAHCTKSPTDTE